MVRIDVDLLDRIAFACKKYPERAVDIAQSFKYNQIKSKTTVQSLLPHTKSKICVLGGWYGLGFMLTDSIKHTYHCVDIDPVCESIGNALSRPNFHFTTADALTYDVSHFHTVVNCSTEHMDRHLLQQWFTSLPNGTRCVFQNNNNFQVPDHINCFASASDFEEYLCEHFGILETITDRMDNSTERYTVLCKKM